MLNVPDDPRTDEQRRADSKTIAHQVELVERRRGDSDLENEVIGRLVEGRGRRRDREQISLLDEGEGRQLAASGEVLISADDLTDEVREELIARGFRIKAVEGLNEPREEGTGRVYRVLGMEPHQAARSEVGRACASVDDSRLRPNFVTPMGIVMKALCGPENTAGPGLAHPGTSPSSTPLRIAVIDTGISAADRDDGWLTGIENSQNRDELYADRANQVLDLGAGHGTFGSGVVQQLAPGAEITAYRALQSDGLGTEVEVAEIMLTAVRDGAQILNLSLGFETEDDSEPLALQAAVELITAHWPDVLMIAAAGNTGRDRKCWPGAFDQVTSVAALTQTMDPAPWSTRGDWVDCSTIGEGVLSTYVVGQEDALVDPDGPDTFVGPNPWALWTGTSFAAPQVTGAVAQIAERDGISPRDALDQLLRTGNPIPGYGQAIEILPPT